MLKAVLRPGQRFGFGSARRHKGRNLKGTGEVTVIDSIEEQRSISEARAVYAKPKLLVDLTTSMLLLGGAPNGVTRVETKLARALLDAEHLNPMPVIMKADGTLRAMEVDAARHILDLWDAQVDVPLSLRGAYGHTLIDLTGGSDDTAETSKNNYKLRQRIVRNIYAARVLFRQPGKIFRGTANWDELTIRFMLQRGRSPEEARAPREDPYDKIRHETHENAQLIVTPTPADYFWTAGLYSQMIRPRPLLEIVSGSGMSVGCLLYDIIQLLYPEYNPPDIDRDVYRANTLDLMEVSDMLLSISGWTRDTYVNLGREERRAHAPIKVLPLGADIAVPFLSDAAQKALRAAVTERPFALIVGTVEPRKNITHLLDVWEALSPHGTPPSLDLVIVGRKGHRADEEVKRILAHSRFGKNIFWLDSCPDRALTSLYRMATVVLCPSHAEGWGLTVREALFQGRPVIASDNTAHPEAGSGQALLLGSTDVAAWAEKITEILAAPQNFLPDLAKFSPPTWKQAGARLVELIEARIEARMPKD